MTNNWQKFCLIMWKHWLCAKHHKTDTFLELFLPCIVSFSLLIVRSYYHLADMPENRYPQYPVTETLTKTVLYTTNNKLITDALTANAKEFVLLKDSKLLIKQVTTQDNILAGVHIKVVKIKANKILDLKVVLRFPSEEENERRLWHTDRLYPKEQAAGPREVNAPHADNPDYTESNFLSVQYAIVKALILHQNADYKFPQLVLHRFPFPEWTKDPLANEMIVEVIVFLLVMSHYFSFMNLVHMIAIEKEQQLKEAMLIMGLPIWLHWLTWFLRSLIVLIPSILLNILAFKVQSSNGAIFERSNGVILGLLLFMHGCANTTFAFLITALTVKASTASAVGGLIYYLTFVPFDLLQHHNHYSEAKIGLIDRFFACLLANTGLAFGLLLLFRYDELVSGLNFSDLFTPLSYDDDTTLGYIIIVLFCGTIIYMILTLYIEQIYPGKYGIARPWYFIFKPFLWHAQRVVLYARSRQAMSQSINYVEEIDEDAEDEEDLSSYEIGFQMQNVTKRFNAFKALDDVTLNMYDGHITVLMGHNGSGKTTALTLLSGLTAPTNGKVVVGGYDISTNSSIVRTRMGICFEKHVHFSFLTVTQHLYFFCKFKGLNKNEALTETENLIVALDLEEEKDETPHHLSDGVKKKLSVGMAMCANSKYIILDEPTTGLDPISRRLVWDLVHSAKFTRTIVIATNSMIEADTLADRIVILANGKLKCAHSTYALKKKYECGYHLNLEIRPDCIPSKVTALLQSYVPETKVGERVGLKLSYYLPEKKSHNFEPMLKEMETQHQTLGVSGYGISISTLDEVYVTLGQDILNMPSREYNTKAGNADTRVKLEKLLKTTFLGSTEILKNQFDATIRKKYLSKVRHLWLFLLQIIIPFLCLVGAIHSEIPKSSTAFDALYIDYGSYYVSTTLLSGNKDSAMYKIYKKLVDEHKMLEINDIEQYILNKTKENPLHVKLKYILGATIDNGVLEAWFNGEPYHASVLSFSNALNTIYREAIDSQAYIEFLNHPLPIEKYFDNKDHSLNKTSFQNASTFGIIMSFVISFYILNPVEENGTKFKQLQYTAGLNPMVYWFTSLLLDLSCYAFVSLVITILFAIFGFDYIATRGQLLRFLFLLFCFGLHAIPMLYYFSFIYTVPSTAYESVFLYGKLSSSLLIILSVFLQHEFSLQGKILHYIFIILLPWYSFTIGLFSLITMKEIDVFCTSVDDVYPGEACEMAEFCCGFYENYFTLEVNGIGANVTAAILMGIFYTTIIILTDCRQFRKLNCCKSKSRKIGNVRGMTQDSRILHDNKISDLTPSHALVLNNLTKRYGKLLAVDQLCLLLKRYECIGVLGVSGSGKTTTIQMITGEIKITSGDAYINKISISKDLRLAQRFSIGYCPQWNSYLSSLTLRETLVHFAMIRGVHRNDCHKVVEHLAHKLEFYQHLDVRAGSMSNGTQRKLNAALVLIGDPLVLCLDEPTDGMDPTTKRVVWKAFCNRRDRGKCILITTHNMKECEMMSTRIGVMADGAMEFIESQHSIRSKFGTVYQVNIKLKRCTKSRPYVVEIEAIKKFMLENFPTSILTQQYDVCLTYQLQNVMLPLSKIFGILENSKQQLYIVDYSIGRVTTEEIFLVLQRKNLQRMGSAKLSFA